MTLKEFIEKLSKYEKENGEKFITCGSAEITDVEIEIVEGNVEITLDIHDQWHDHHSQI